jgi:hypothetical protein
MDEATKRALFTNALLVAHADADFESREQQLLAAFIDRAGVPRDVARRWYDEMRAGDIAFKPVPDRASAVAALRLAVGVVAADGRLEPRERLALFALAKAVGLSAAELRRVYEESWGKAVLDELFGAAPPSRRPRESVVAVRDGFEALEPTAAASPEVPLDRCTLAEALVLRPAPDWVVWHAAETRDQSLTMLAKLVRALPRAKNVVIVSRHQGPQISYLLEQGATRCLVEPIYPGELAALLST